MEFEESITDSPHLDEKHARNREERLRFIREWAEYVRTHSDDVWDAQVNTLVDSQIESARSVGDERPDVERLKKESALLNPGECESDETDDWLGDSLPFGSYFSLKASRTRCPGAASS